MTDKLEDKPVTLTPPAEAPITATPATRSRHRPAPVSSKAQQEHAAEEIRAISEAPRGTLLHHYKTDKNGLITYANLIIATGHNNLAMNAGITQAAKEFVKGDYKEGALNRVEAVIRCFDPCLSCATHAQGKMGFEVAFRRGGEVVDRKFI